MMGFSPSISALSRWCLCCSYGVSLGTRAAMAASILVSVTVSIGTDIFVSRLRQPAPKFEPFANRWQTRDRAETGNVLVLNLADAARFN